VGLDKESKLDLEVAVKDALFEGVTDDQVLASILLLTMDEVRTGRHLFENPLDEPILYSRYIRPWVEKSLDSISKASNKKGKQNETIW
jgi:hypothetical protein